MTRATRASLLVRLKDLGDDRSWQDFFGTYWRLIYAVATKAGLTDAEAQDVVQETVIAVAKKMPEFEYVPGRDSFRGWLLRVTHWKICDQFRKRSPASQPLATSTGEFRHTAYIDRIPDPSVSELEKVWETEWEKAVLRAGLAHAKRESSSEHYAVFMDYAIKKKPAQEVAGKHRLTVQQVYLIKHRVSEVVRGEVRRLEMQLH